MLCSACVCVCVCLYVHVCVCVCQSVSESDVLGTHRAIFAATHHGRARADGVNIHRIASGRRGSSYARTPPPQLDGAQASGAGVIEDEKRRVRGWKPRVCAAVLNASRVRETGRREGGREGGWEGGRDRDSNRDRGNERDRDRRTETQTEGGYLPAAALGAWPLQIFDAAVEALGPRERGEQQARARAQAVIVLAVTRTHPLTHASPTCPLTHPLAHIPSRALSHQEAHSEGIASLALCARFNLLFSGSLDRTIQVSTRAQTYTHTHTHTL